MKLNHEANWSDAELDVAWGRRHEYREARGDEAVTESILTAMQQAAGGTRRTAAALHRVYTFLAPARLLSGHDPAGPGQVIESWAARRGIDIPDPRWLSEKGRRELARRNSRNSPAQKQAALVPVEPEPPQNGQVEIDLEDLAKAVLELAEAIDTLKGNLGAVRDRQERIGRELAVRIDELERVYLEGLQTEAKPRVSIFERVRNG